MENRKASSDEYSGNKYFFNVIELC